MSEPRRLMAVRDETEGAAICERLRAAGIKCAVEPFPDANSLAAIWGGQAPDVLVVLVDEHDVAKARAAIGGDGR